MDSTSDRAILLDGVIGETEQDKSSALPTSDMDTLDEPISQTLIRDLTSIVAKVKHIILPVSKTDTYKSVMKDWDLWGPLVLCTFYCLTINHDQSMDNQSGLHFAELFLLLWLGFYVVAVNFKLLAVSSRRRTSTLAVPSIFQLVCVFGYCMAIPCIGIFLVKILTAIFSSKVVHLFYEKTLIGLVMGFAWPTWSALRVLSRFQSREKLVLGAYPVALLFFVVAWFLISAH